MWSDNETAKDYLNFSGVAETVAEVIVTAEGRPISIGVSGAWGVGKSSMIKLIRDALIERDQGEDGKFVFVEFNAWLYQGYDDARAALLEIIASELEKRDKKGNKVQKKIRRLVTRINWLRVSAFVTNAVLSQGIFLPGLLAAMAGNAIDNEDTNSATLLKSESVSSPPKEIHAIRKEFEQILKDLDATVIVFIDDLDRCLPHTAISTLEAIRLLLFLDRAAFVIAADDSMIKHAMRVHFDGADNEQVTNYFDKLIQVPIRVPPLGTQEVRAYMMLLFIENSDLEPHTKEIIRAKTCERLTKSWKGKRVDRMFMETIVDDLPADLVSRFDLAERLAPLMTTATQIAGNPRLIKRFMNALSIRMAISKRHGVGIDESVLAKMLLFERCAVPAVFEKLARRVNEDDEGKPRFLAEWENNLRAGNDANLEEDWNSPFIREWLALLPSLADQDLRGVLYVSREHAPLITPEDRMSPEGAAMLQAIVDSPGMAKQLHDRLEQLAGHEINLIMDRLLREARSITEWGAPEILRDCIAICEAHPDQGSRLAVFLQTLSPGQIKPNIVPLVKDYQWAEAVMDSWQSSAAVSDRVKRAITGLKE